MSKFIIFAFLFTSAPQAPASHPADFPMLVVSKMQSEKGERYIFELCDPGSCAAIGKPPGYTLKQIKGLSGLLQQRIGAPLLGASQAVVGLIVAFFGGLATLPTSAITTAVAYKVLASGAVVGAAGPSLLSQISPMIYKISPVYQWDKGGVKAAMELATESLAAGPSDKALIVFKQSDFDSLEIFYDKVDLVDLILMQL